MTSLLQFITTEIQTVCLAGLLLISVVLPFMAGRLGSRGANIFRVGRRIAWTGQVLAGFSGLLILLVPQFSIIGLVAATAVAAVFAWKLRCLGVTQP